MGIYLKQWAIGYLSENDLGKTQVNKLPGLFTKAYAETLVSKLKAKNPETTFLVINSESL